MSDDPFSPIARHPNGIGKQRKTPLRCIVVPVPPRAPAAPERHPRLGKPSQRWTYCDGKGRLLGYVCRFEEKDGYKSFRPLCLYRTGGFLKWRWEAWPAPRPLYGLGRLSGDTAAPVIVTEGEKSADAAALLLPDHVVVTSPSGSKAAARADWSPLSGRTVTIWPDADAPGQEYAEAAAKLLTTAGAHSVSIATPPDGAPKGWDAGDAAREGWTTRQTIALIEAALPWHQTANGVPTISVQTDSKDNADCDRKKPRQRDALLAAADDATLWHSPQKIAFATLEINGHCEHWRIESTPFKRWLAGQFYSATATAPAGQMLADALRVLEVRAIHEGLCHQPLTRTGWHDGVSWLDLCDNNWRAIKITANGWTMVDTPPVKFVRSEIMAALPEPVGGHMIEEFRGWVNAEDNDYKLVVGWLIAALWGKATTFPVLALGGEQGSGKSTMARLLRMLVDPSVVAALAPPRDERDLFTMATNVHVLSFDNVSKVDPFFSDALCRLSTGSGFLTRKLHSDAAPYWFEGARPIILNGIPSLTGRADLAERSLAVRLHRIDEDYRRPEDEWWAKWEAVYPRVLGALLDALSSAIHHHDDVRLDRFPRMADFAKLMTAAEPGLGWDPGSFMTAYEVNRRASNDAIFEADPVAMMMRKFMFSDHLGDRFWEGTATELLVELNRIVPEDMRRSRIWPTKVNALGNAVDRAVPLLRDKSIHVEKHLTGAQRLIRLTMV